MLLKNSASAAEATFVRLTALFVGGAKHQVDNLLVVLASRMLLVAVTLQTVPFTSDRVECYCCFCETDMSTGSVNT